MAIQFILYPILFSFTSSMIGVFIAQKGDMYLTCAG
jgi:hypothetical protein